MHFRKFFIIICCCFFSIFFALANSSKNGKLLLGIDVLIQNNYDILLGKRIGLLTNSASRSSEQKLTVEYFINNPNFTLKAIFTPEHGFYATIPAGKYVPDDSLYGVPVFSLYGNNRKPTPYRLSLIDIIVVDLQDIGIRSYTFISTLFYVMLAASEAGLPVVILDRPNPLGGNLVDGNVLELDKTSFVGIVPIPYIHGCTIGELAIMMNEEGWLGMNSTPKKCKLTVVRMENWKRNMNWEDTGLEWVATSPNVTSPNSIRGLAMFGVIGELKLIYLGIGSNMPFQYISIPKVNFNKIKKVLLNLKFDGVEFRKIDNKSNFHNLKHTDKGFLVMFDKNKDIKLYSYGMILLFELKKNFPELFQEKNLKSSAVNMFKKVTGTDKLFDYLLQNDEDSFKSYLNRGLNDFLKIRSKYLLYR